MSKGLTEKEERFVLEYMVDLNPVEAYKRSNGRPITSKSASRAARELLSKPHVVGAIQAIRSDRARRLRVTADDVVSELSRISFSDVRKLFTETGRLKRMDEIDDDTAAAIASIECEERWEGSGKNRKVVGYIKKIKLWDKNTALVQLCKHLGLFPQRDNRSQQIDVNVVVQQQMAKLSQLTDEELDALIEIQTKTREASRGKAEGEELSSGGSIPSYSTGGEVPEELPDVRPLLLGNDSGSGEGDLELAHGFDMPGVAEDSGESVSGTSEGT